MNFGYALFGINSRKYASSKVIVLLFFVKYFRPLFSFSFVIYESLTKVVLEWIYTKLRIEVFADRATVHVRTNSCLESFEMMNLFCILFNYRSGDQCKTMRDVKISLKCLPMGIWSVPDWWIGENDGLGENPCIDIFQPPSQMRERCFYIGVKSVMDLQ